MKFYMPVRVFDEPDCVRRHGADLAALGKKALLVTGRRSAVCCGAQADVELALSEHGVSSCCFSEVEENPSVETVLKAAEYGLEQKADFVIGIGGGSPLDAAKAAAFLMCRRIPSADALYDASLPARALPVAAVPTTCGTGSEVTGVSVLTLHSRRTKASIPHKIFPSLALLDGKYLRTAPQSMLLNTSADALAHLTESFLSARADDWSRAAALAGLRLWGKTRQLLFPGESDLALMMRAASFGGVAIAQTGTSVPHALSYILTYEQGIPHGAAAGVFLCGFLNEAPEALRRQVLEAAGLSSLTALHALLPKVRVRQDVLQRAFETVLANKPRMSSACFPLDEAALRRIVNSGQPEENRV